LRVEAVAAGDFFAAFLPPRGISMASRWGVSGFSRRWRVWDRGIFMRLSARKINKYLSV
jgi:hypothetical protein